jgi:hypothetical protein
VVSALDVQEALNTLKCQAAILEFVASARSGGAVINLSERSNEWLWHGLFVMANDAQATLSAIESALSSGDALNRAVLLMKGGE